METKQCADLEPAQVNTNASTPRGVCDNKSWAWVKVHRGGSFTAER